MSSLNELEEWFQNVNLAEYKYHHHFDLVSFNTVLVPSVFRVECLEGLLRRPSE